MQGVLERGGHLGMLIDQHFTRGVVVDFLGRPALANPILGKFARRFDCPVHGVRVVRLPGHRFRLELTPPLDLPRDADGEIDVAGAMQAMTARGRGLGARASRAVAVDAPALAPGVRRGRCARHPQANVSFSSRLSMRSMAPMFGDARPFPCARPGAPSSRAAVGCRPGPAAGRAAARGRRALHQPGLLLLPAGRPVLGRPRAPARPHRAARLPVDYWDYLGWKDTLAQRPFGERQRGYSGVHGARQVFTPQAVINGSRLDRRLRPAGAGEATARSSARGGLPVPVRGEERDERIVVEIGAEPAPKAALKGDVWLVPVLRSRPVAIGGGENRGRTATYVNVVRDLVRARPLDRGPDQLRGLGVVARPTGADSYGCSLQAEGDGPGRVLGAAKGPGLKPGALDRDTGSALR